MTLGMKGLRRVCLFGVGVLSLALSACEGPAGDPGAAGADGEPGGDGVSGATVGVAPAAVNVELGATANLAAATTPSADPAETYEWTSSNPAVATVDASGTVTGVAVGTALVTATGEDSGATGVGAISVVEPAPGPVSFADDVLPLFTTGNLWYVGAAACNATGCHTGVGGAHDLDMGTYAGVLLGADAGDEPILEPGAWSEAGLRARMRNNRMPWGIPTTVPRNGPAIAETAASFPDLGWDDASSLADTNGLVKLVEAWIDEGAVEGDFDYTDSNADVVTRNFDDHVLPLFTTEGIWAAGTEACNAAGCHNGVGGAHDLDMGTYEGIILGADAGEEPILIPGNSGESPLRKRLRNNRMPWGMPNWIPRDGLNSEVGTIGAWVEAGAEDN